MGLPTFVTEDASAIQADLLADMQTRLGRAIAPADIEMLQVNSRAYARMVYNIALNEAARQNLAAFATGSALDYLAELVGVTRLASATARCTITFTLDGGNTGTYIPAGTRIQSSDEQVVFTTDEGINIDDGDTSGTVSATCATSGTIGNNYAIGSVSTLLDPQPFVVSVENIDITNGGTDDETDAGLYGRIKLAPNSFSVAGPTDAYIFWAKTAHPSIVDVGINNLDVTNTTETPGTVHIYPLCAGGVLPSTEIKALVLAICSAEKVRPLCDTVIVTSPIVTEYSINVGLTLFSGVDSTAILAQVNQQLQAYVNAGLNQLGRDIIKAQIMGWCMIEGSVYNVSMTDPTDDVSIDEYHYAMCTGITVSIVGYV